MKVLKYESFLETMQFAVLTNAQRLAKRKKQQNQEDDEDREERRKAKQEEDPDEDEDWLKTPQKNWFGNYDEEMEPEGQGEMEEGDYLEGSDDDDDDQSEAGYPE